jgi:hypothetical protein
VREKLIEFLQREYPLALPRTRQEFVPSAATASAGETGWPLASIRPKATK